MNVIYPRCAGLDVHKKTVVACARSAAYGPCGRRCEPLQPQPPACYR